MKGLIKHSTALFLILMTLAPVRAEELKPFTPARDMKGTWAMQENPALPDVLILGDSISIGYTRAVRSLLAGKANVFRPMNPSGKNPENCGDTPMGIKGLDKWLGSTRWDVIHFNWGLWDLCYRNPKAKTQGNRDKVNGKLSVNPEQYEQNLETIVTRLKATGAKLVWASTTVVPEGEAGRIVGDDVKYNMTAARVMQRHGIPTDDLHRLTADFAGKLSVGPHDVHFTVKGYQRLANQVADEISRLLEARTLTTSYSPAEGIGEEPGVMRRDPSDIIKAGDLYHIWYTKGKYSNGYDATIFHATSPDGHVWTETGEALSRGPAGSWDEQSVFTPNILVAENRVWLFYTAVPKPFTNGDRNTPPTMTAIGLATADSPDGPWTKLPGNPIMTPSPNHQDFDSLRVDDSCLIARNGKYWLYYKGRQWDKSPAQTKLGVAIAEQPQGPYVKYSGNPLIQGNHEVLVWPQGKGVAAMIGTTGPKALTRTVQYAEDGLHFSKTHDILNVPSGAGAYRPEAFTDSGKGELIDWGVHIANGKEGSLPFLERFELKDTHSQEN